MNQTNQDESKHHLDCAGRHLAQATDYIRTFVHGQTNIPIEDIINTVKDNIISARNFLDLIQLDKI